MFSVHNMWIYIKTYLQLNLLENGWELCLHNDSAAGDHHTFANNHVLTKSFYSVSFTLKVNIIMYRSSIVISTFTFR